MAASMPPETSPPAQPPTPPKRSPIGMVVAAIVVVVIVVLASLYFLHVGPFATPTPAAPQEAGGFTLGSLVTFLYTGNYLCTPGLLTFFPNETNASGTTGCEVGEASQSAVAQVPEWVLVPAFAGLTIFGVAALGASARGFPMFGGSSLLTECGAGGSPTGCPDHPTYIYSPAFTVVEQSLNIQTGYGGLPEGVLPTPAHDHLLNTTTTYPNVEWGTIVVLVFDPNIWPDRATGTCTATVTSNLSSPAAHCLTSLSALDAALSTHSSSVATANSGNPIWTSLTGSSSLQVIVPGDISIAQVNNLNANLYIPFSVQPGAPSSFPT